MALRPVSELGLVDLTDLASRPRGGRTSKRGRSAPKRSGPPQARAASTLKRRGTSDTPAARSDGTPKRISPSKSFSASAPRGAKPPRKSPSPTARGSSVRGGQKRSNRRPKGVGASTAENSKRSGTTSRRSTDASAYGRRRHPSSPSEWNGDLLETQSALSTDETEGSVAARVGLPALTGALAVAGGFILGRIALRR